MEESRTLKQEQPQYEGWEKIGYHRIMGGFFYNIIFALFALLMGLILPYIIPYTETLGYYNILTSIFASIFTLSDLGTASALSRFVAEYRVKDPQKTLQYIRFFVWFQAISGLIQTTVISMIGLWGLRDSDMSFMPWMFVWLSIVQYPGMLGVFTEALKGFQQYGKTALIGVLNTVVFQLITLILGIQIGQYYGRLNPEIGPLMGAAYGMVIGYYVDDFTTVLISGKMFSNLIKPMGFSMKDIFYPHIEKQVAIESIKFGMGVMLFTLSFQSFGTFYAIIYVSNLPNYSTFIGTLALIKPFITLAETVNRIHIGNHRSAVSEAYFNDKRNYGIYILSNGFRLMGEVTFLILPITLVGIPMLIEELFPAYLGIFNQVFFIYLFYSIFFQHSHLMNEVLIGTGNHRFNIFITLLESIVHLIGILLCIKYNLGIYTLIYPNIACTIVKQGIGWIFINKRIINLKINYWQNWIAPLGAGFVYYLLIFTFFNLLQLFIGSKLIILGLGLILGIYVLPGLGYFIPLGLFGGYDDNTLMDMERAVQISGPSKLIVKYWYKGAKWGSKKSMLFNKYPMDYDKVGEEIGELMEMKKKVDLESQSR